MRIDVTCVMPTTIARGRFIPLACRWFLEQTFVNRELLVVSDGPDVGYLLPHDPRIRYLQMGGTRSVGAKMNAGVDEAGGEYIALWEDDDWHGPTRLQEQMAVLEDGRARKCGSSRMLFWDMQERVMRRLTMPRHVAHGSVLAHRSVFDRHPYEDRNDGDFEWQVRSNAPTVDVASDGWYVAMRHTGNTWACDYQARAWEVIPVTLADVAGPEVAALYEVRQ